MQINKRKYNLLDLLKIPLVCTPISTAIRMLIPIIDALIPAGQVVATSMFIDRAISIFNGKMQYNEIYLPLVLIVLIVIYEITSGIIRDFVSEKLEIGLAENFQASIIDKRAKLEYKYIENNETWDLISRICTSSTNKLSQGFNDLMQTIQLVLMVCSILYVITSQVWWAGLVMVVLSIPLFFVAFKSGKNTYDAYKDSQKHTRRAEYLQGVITGRDNVEERSLFSYTSDLNEKWYEKYEIARKIGFKAEAKNFIRMKGTGLFTLIISMSIVAVLVLPLSEGLITVGMFVSLVSAVINLVQNMSWSLVYLTSKIVENREFLKDLSAFSNYSEVKDALSIPAKIDKFKFKELEFKGVSFAYPDTERYILKDLSFKIVNGKHYAFVGVNGAGKTTITKLLCGMYDNYEGTILINGKNLKDYSLNEIKSMFSVVFQDFAKYQIKLSDNIYFGDINNKNESRIKEAVKTMELDDMVEKLPEGIDTYLGKIKEDGTDVSGGQWQRIAIARSVYSKAGVRILDEPTAALDPVAESNVYEMFGKISKGETAIFITHRLGAAKLADEIIVLEDGTVFECGSHDKLMEKQGIYASMFESQRSWYV